MKHIVFQLFSDLSFDLNINREFLYDVVDDPEAEIECFLLWLQETGIVSTLNYPQVSFTPSACREMFNTRYPVFQAAVRSLGAVTPEQFAQDDRLLESLLIDLKHGIASPHGFYISLDGSDPIPFDRFLRRAEPEKIYYIHDVVLEIYD